MTDAGNDDRTDDRGEARTGFDPRMLEALVCPRTGGTLRYDAAAGELISDAARLAFPIRGGIPVMLVDEARALDD